MRLSNLQALLLVLVGLLAATARADDSEDKARADLERQLRELVQIPPPEVVVTFEGLPKPDGYKLLEAEFLLDGQPLATPAPETLNGPGSHLLLATKLEEGTHTLVSRVTYVNDSWSLFSETNGYLWKMTATVGIQAQRGLKLRVKVVPGIVPKAPDPRLKLKLTHDVAAEMTAELADATLPEPAPESTPVEQGTSQAANTPQQASGTQAASTTQPASGTQPAGTQAPVKAARLLLKVTASKKPVEATVFVRGEGAPRQLALGRKARKPEPVELAPGTYTVEVVAKGYLAQSRRVRLSEGLESKLSFALVRAPAKKGQQVRMKGERVEPPTAPRYAEKQATPRKGTALNAALLVDLLVREVGTRLRIEGHTDSHEGTAEELQRLSEARARAVAEQLIRAGVDPSRLEMAGVADSRPKAPNLTPRGRELNRRVELVLLPR